MEHLITLTVEWVPREENTLADELSKLLTPDDSMLSREFFRKIGGAFRDTQCGPFRVRSQ